MLLISKRGRGMWLDGFVGLAWAVVAAAYFSLVLSGGGWIYLGLLIYYSLVALAFLRRAPARSSGPWWETVVAMVNVFLPIVILRPADGGLPLLGQAVGTVALAGIILGLLNLGRSFAIAPADRGLVTGGLYRWVRHPLYAFQFLFYIGFYVANPSWNNALGLVLTLVLQVIRIRWEEDLLSGYEEYAARVQWRLIPYIW